MSQLIKNCLIPAAQPVDQQPGNRFFNQSDSISLIFKQIQDRTSFLLVNKATSRVSQATIERSFKQLEHDSTTKAFQKRHPTLSSFIRSNQISNYRQLVNHLRKEAQDLRLTGTKEYQAFKTSTASKYLLSLDSLIEQTNYDRANQGNRLWDLLGATALPKVKNYQTWNEAIQAIEVDGIISLNLDHSGLTRIPYGIFRLRALQTLTLDNNFLTALPHEIGQLRALQTLELCHNQLAALPREIGQLRALQSLSFVQNHLAALPREIGQLRVLSLLELSNNQLAALPREIGQLRALQTLNLSGNLLATLPREIGQLRALQYLFINANQLTALHESFEGLVSRLVLGGEHVRQFVEEGRKLILSSPAPL